MVRNANKLEKDIRQKEEELLQEFKEELKAMNKKEFEAYFRTLLEKYYSVVFSIYNDFPKYYEDSDKKYKLIKKVKSILASDYNNLDNFENYVRLDIVEDIAFKQMIELDSMEKSYSNIIYGYATKELKYITDTFNKLIEAYKKTSSEDILEIIESMFNTDLAIIVKEIRKLPIHKTMEEIEEPYIISKKNFKKETLENLTAEELEEIPEVYESVTYNKPVLSVYLPKVLEEFNSTVKELEKILPEDLLTDFYFKVTTSEAIEYLNLMKEVLTDVPEEEVTKMVAYLMHLQEEQSKDYLYNILDSWS